jgi:hypothetical protein
LTRASQSFSTSPTVGLPIQKHILFLADRNILIDQTIQQDFAPFGEVMHKIGNRTVERRYEVYLSLYQAVTGREEWKQIYRQFPPDFFDLVVIDECHRGSAAEDSAWREVLDYFHQATHLGLTATPKEKHPAKGETLVEDPEYNLKYFGNPIYTYSLRQGIEDGFLAPYKVIRVVTDALLDKYADHGIADIEDPECWSSRPSTASAARPGSVAASSAARTSSPRHSPSWSGSSIETAHDQGIVSRRIFTKKADSLIIRFLELSSPSESWSK